MENVLATIYFAYHVTAPYWIALFYPVVQSCFHLILTAHCHIYTRVSNTPPPPKTFILKMASATFARMLENLKISISHIIRS
jgi:hypothetical protein